MVPSKSRRVVGTTRPIVSNDRSVSEREQAEITRSAKEASRFVFSGINTSQIDRYLNPAASTPYFLEYAFHLLGDIRSKKVVDLGCGTGENMVPLAKRGADVTGIDISPDLIQLALQRISCAEVSARAIVGSAYDTGFKSESVDVILCVALIHHLDIPKVRDEMYRILRTDGVIVLAEPIRFSKLYDRVRKLLPAREDTSQFEHPLTMQEMDCMCEPFTRENQRVFRLPFVAIPERLFHRSSRFANTASDWVLHTCPALAHFATGVVVRLRKQSP
ncbi:MAG: methyltransferase domain-containing protein [Acidobacteria bacterium]|nr:methyltransferase domain-containing protein [Acidobacteriota bacterium]